jgi:CubicO group peptidase (beta-lactamase class C family)
MQLNIINIGVVAPKWLPFFFLLTGTVAYAQDKTSEIDKVFSWATHTTPGCACAVSQNGKMIVNRAYGSADLERNVPINTNTIFDAGSLRKQFVAAAALLLVEEGRLSLSDDVRKYIPELPDYGHKITIDNLLTHTSGIRDWTGILPLASRSTDAMQIILRQRSLNFVPGEEWFYSNSGYVLMKEIVVRISKMPFAEFMRQRIFDTLGMKSTSYYEDLREVIKNRALAYDKEGGKWTSAMLLDNDRGGGGALFSTASDLLIWNEALTNGRLGKLVTGKLHEQTQLNNGRKLDHSRGLFFDTYHGAKEVWYSGSADGYKSWLGRYPEYGLSIAIMCNSGDGTDRRAFAHRLFDLFVTDTNASKTEFNPLPPAYEVAGLDLGSKTGLYFSERNGEPLRLVEFRGRLRVDGGPGFEAVTKDRFRRWGAMPQFMSQDAFELQFVSNELLELKSMEGNITKYRRARLYTPSAAGLKAFAGRYVSDEIGSVFLVTAIPGGLAVSLEHAPRKSFDLKPVDTDAFQFSRITIRFRRDKNGKVVALDFSNPAIRNVKFTRLDEKGSAR